MTIDYETPRIEQRLVAEATGIGRNTLLSYFQRGHFRIFGHATAAGDNGLNAHLFSLRDAIGIGVAQRLIACGVSPRAAFEAGMVKFAHTGSDRRAPGALFDEHEDGDTFLAFFPSTGGCNIFPVDGDALPWDSCRRNPDTGDDDDAIIVKLNPVVHKITAALALSYTKKRIRALRAPAHA